MSRAVWQISVKILAYSSWGPGFHPQYHTYTQNTRKKTVSFTAQIIRTLIQIMLEEKNLCSTDIKKDVYSQLMLTWVPSSTTRLFWKVWLLRALTGWTKLSIDE